MPQKGQNSSLSVISISPHFTMNVRNPFVTQSTRNELLITYSFQSVGMEFKVSLLVCLSICHLYVYLSVCLSVCLSICPSVCVSVRSFCHKTEASGSISGYSKFFHCDFLLLLLMHVRKVVNVFGKKSCVRTGVRKPGNTWMRH